MDEEAGHGLFSSPSSHLSPLLSRSRQLAREGRRDEEGGTLRGLNDSYLTLSPYLCLAIGYFKPVSALSVI